MNSAVPAFGALGAIFGLVVVLMSLALALLVPLLLWLIRSDVSDARQQLIAINTNIVALHRVLTRPEAPK